MGNDLWQIIASFINQLEITALIYCVVVDFSQCGNFLLEMQFPEMDIFQDWVYHYFMEVYNVFYFVFNTPHQRFSTFW